MTLFYWSAYVKCLYRYRYLVKYALCQKHRQVHTQSKLILHSILANEACKHPKHIQPSCVPFMSQAWLFFHSLRKLWVQIHPLLVIPISSFTFPSQTPFLSPHRWCRFQTIPGRKAWLGYVVQWGSGYSRNGWWVARNLGWAVLESAKKIRIKQQEFLKKGKLATSQFFKIATYCIGQFFQV